MYYLSQYFSTIKQFIEKQWEKPILQDSNPTETPLIVLKDRDQCTWQWLQGLGNVCPWFICTYMSTPCKTNHVLNSTVG